MGGIVKGLFGGSSSKNSSGNHAFGEIKNLLTGNIGQGNSAMGTIAALLGIGGDSGAASGAYKNYLNSSGYKSLMEGGQDAITGSAAARGFLQSGSTGKALTKFGQDLASQKLDDYINNLTNLGQYGLNSAQTIVGAGQYSKGKGSSHTGIVNSLFGSDRRLKQNIKLLRRAPNGLGVYSYEYKAEPGVVRIGVMADEVARILPEALGPVINGFASVHYDRLKEAA